MLKFGGGGGGGGGIFQCKVLVSLNMNIFKYFTYLIGCQTLIEKLHFNTKLLESGLFLGTIGHPFLSPFGQEYPFLQVSEIFLSRSAVSA